MAPRAPIVQAQTRLHGKPAASFFVKMNATGAAASIKAIPKDAHVNIMDTETISTADQTLMAADPTLVANKPCSSLSIEKENDASAQEGSMTSSSVPDTTGAISFVDEMVESTSGDVHVGGDFWARTRRNPSGHKKKHRAGARGAGCQGVKGWDGWDTTAVPPGVCSLDGELILLGGVLRDPKIRTWVETTLGAPGRRR